jgi:two-component system, OmpR family, response regulator
LRILLIEDDVMLGGGLTQALRDAGFSVDWARDGAEGDLAIANGGYGVILLDLGLPKKPGANLLESLRKRGDATPLVIITARDQTTDRVTGLDLGADDYLVKPFEFSELLARIRAVVRRNHGSPVSIIGNGQLSIDLASHEASGEGPPTVLPAKEFALLQALLQRPGKIMSRAELEERIYGWGEEVESNAVDVLIHNLRRKLGKDAIRNVRGAGWMVASGRDN